MFEKVTLRGVSAEILWCSKPAASLTKWTVVREKDEKTARYVWRLAAMLGPRVDRFQLRQRPLLFAAPRKGGFWLWPVLAVTVGQTSIAATLGPPEQ